MKRTYWQALVGIMLPVAMLLLGVAPPLSMAMQPQAKLDYVRQHGIPDYNGSPNWANSPPLTKFVNALPVLCGPGGTNKNNLDQCIPVAIPDQTTYPGTDYYEIELVQYRERMHTDLPALKIGFSKEALGLDPEGGGTLLRGYKQKNVPASAPSGYWISGEESIPHYLGPVILAQKDRPVRVKFINSLPTGNGGDLFIPTDTTVMGSGPSPLSTRSAGVTDTETCQADPTNCFTQNRSDIHLHGARTPWISDGTAHQWITPAGEVDDAASPLHKGASVAYVPDMWFDASGNTIAGCAGKNVCTTANATNNPGPGAQTYYYTNAQSARMMFYHDHSWGITRLNVYAGLAAGYFITDATEVKLADLLPNAAHTIPLIIQDKTFVDDTTIIDNPLTAEGNDGTDPTWIWGSKPGSIKTGYSATGAVPVKGDLWWPHVYVPAQNPYNPNFSGINDYGRWHYGPWFWPPVDAAFPPVANIYFDEVNDPLQPPEVPGVPNPSWGAEAFMDTPVINGTAYPKLTVEPATYRFRILNGAHDRFWNLQLYVADTTNPTEMTMIPAIPANAAVTDNDGFDWPADGREGDVPDPAKRGPAMVQIATEGGFLPKPVVLKNRPINWNVDPTTFTAGLVLQQNQGGGTLMLGPAERADVIVDFSAFAGKTLILYNDAPAPWPALDPHYDYYTGAPDNTGMGGSPGTPIGKGPNTRTIMQIVVSGSGGPATINAEPASLQALKDAFRPVAAGGRGVFDEGQEPIIVGQSEYDGVYYRNGQAVTFPKTWPNWGVSRITDTAISFKTPDGSTVNMYPLEPKAIQDEMGEVFDEFGRMSAKLGLELAKTTALNQTFVLQNFVDPATEKVKKDQIQIWKITHNGVDTHPVHFHLFEVQLLNRVGWDGFIYKPDPNELGWKDTVRISPLEDTIVALRPAKIPVPFNVPNSIRTYNPAYPTNAPIAGFTNIDPTTAQPLTTPTINEVVNFGQEYLWHCHILSHEESDMMRPIILNANSLLYTQNGANGVWQWDMGKWTQITTAQPVQVVAAGPNLYGRMANNTIWEWDGYKWAQITALAAEDLVAGGSTLYADFGANGMYQRKNKTWTGITANNPDKMIANERGLYAYFPTLNGLYEWDGTKWTGITANNPSLMTVTDKEFFGDFPGLGLYRWSYITTSSKYEWTGISGHHPSSMVASGKMLYGYFPSLNALYQWNGSASRQGTWNAINDKNPSLMAAADSTFYGYFQDPYRLYQWDGKAWTKISNNVATNLVTSGSVLYGTFLNDGQVYKREFGQWSPLQNTYPASSIKPAY